ncbi:type I methionyl aminopeptidase [Candidatus Wolfebacteria bacterium]|nr:type I methionyl aminopeptidase [Candidatus Wolfebacteria bacterium]
MVRIYSQEEIEKIAASGGILANVLKSVAKEAKIGVSLKDLDNLAFKLTKEAGADPAFLGYRPRGAEKSYSASICSSLNDVVVHGLPTSYKLKNGDIFKIDFGVKYQGFYSDSAITIAIGKISKEADNLINATKIALDEAICMAQPGNHLGDIGWIIEKIAKKFKVKVIKNLTGHGIGKNLHEEPTIYNFGEKGTGLELKPGMVLAIEPMFSTGTDQIIQKKDESWATRDRSLSAHFEHTIAIRESGSSVLTNYI